MTNEDRIFQIISHAVENGLETPSQAHMTEVTGLQRPALSTAISRLLASGKIVKHSGGWATTYTIPGTPGQTLRRWPEHQDFMVDNSEYFDHEAANRKFVAALAKFFRNREKSNA